MTLGTQGGNHMDLVNVFLYGFNTSLKLGKFSTCLNVIADGVLLNCGDTQLNGEIVLEDEEDAPDQGRGTPDDGADDGAGDGAAPGRSGGDRKGRGRQARAPQVFANRSDGSATARRSTFLSILPASVLGRSSMTSMREGTLYSGKRCRQKRVRSSGSMVHLSR